MRIIPAKKPAAPGEAEFIPQPDDLKRRALVVDGDYDQAAEPAIRRAQKALERVRERSRDALAEGGARLAGAFADFERSPRSAGRRERLFRAAHDLRGLAPDLGEELAGRIAGSLARLLGYCPAASLALIRAHVDALRASLRDRDDPLADEVAAELERRSNDAIAGASGGEARS
ncbi:MAG: hypothetical protein EA385_04880 [Salinarimonadaceae bacterium]|nr:MAG: hypothetical protein EA385_04880 [Salinarimonadaceae bacterium]